ncbi:hypothetical protein [Cupriavidus sp. IDO]|uniref:hypothetical protein n=1 Tax=Cupriavidus sp. IDO TaxID=1539142 RepID=UPI0005796221|nr:hypothetical protein [Cupriavidus sp. IDO]KWR91146.1 hypothetical protein RM96_05300 [Cupriavidus sp. IDO]
MSSHVFVEEGEYFCHCSVWEAKDGKWEASVLFERKIDHTNEFVPGLRHKIRDRFASRDEAMREAVAYARACVENTKTGL